jgi:hypothetical protein
MMKKLLLVAGSLVVVGTLAAAGLVYAQTQEPPPATATQEAGARPRHAPGDRPDGPLHDLKQDALAAGLGLTRAELDSRLANGERPDEIAQALGFSQEEFVQIKQDARETAIKQGVAQGLITQEQADEMLSHAGGPGFGPGHKGGPYGLGGPDGPLHDLIQDALADGLGLSRTELDSRIADGQRLPEIAAAQGLTREEFDQIKQDARKTAINAGVAQGLITQEQADDMLSHQGGHGVGHGFGTRPGERPFGPPADGTPEPATKTGFSA